MKFVVLVLALISAVSAGYIAPFFSGYSAYSAPVVSTYSAAPIVSSPYVAPYYGYGYGYSAYPAYGVDFLKKKA
ncbi:unnamed protein product [Hermetia illucens]|uniref:Neuropeptide-like 4 n=1 Tax=Hermetia illucens TaxID=343691 RepID=A0A7R8YRK1_HERIL|nr:unnamed protein product [Hermetia illucens]